MTLPSTFGQVFSREVPQSLSGVAGSMRTNDAQRKEVFYQALVACSEQNIFVNAWLPEQVGIDVAANYEAPYAQGIGAINDKFGALAQFVGMNLTTQAMTAQIWQGGSFINFSLQFIFQAETSAELEVMKPIRDMLRLTMPKDTTPGGGGILSAPGPHVDIKKLAQNGGDLAADGIKSISQTLSNPSGIIDTAKQIASRPLEGLSKLKDTANGIAQKVSSALVNSVVNNISLQVGQFLYFPSVVITDVNPMFDTVLNNEGKPMRATVQVNFRTFYIPTENDIQFMFMNMQVDDLRGVRLG